MHWILLAVIVVFALALDLGVFHRESKEVDLKEATRWTIVWVVLAMLFALGIAIFESYDKAILFLTGYVVEESLSVDNLFLFIVIFQYFSVKPKYQHRVLFWGILGAILTRGLLIVAGVELLDRFEWLIYVFGGLILFTGIKTFNGLKEEIDLESNAVLKIVKRFVRTKTDYEGERFFVIEHGKLFATPLLVVLIVVELTDILFAFDSIPAILGITRDVFIVYSSNLFAIMGLRSMYFVLAGMLELFKYLSIGVSCILIFVGFKMLTESFIHISPLLSLGVISSILAISIFASWRELDRKKVD